jgi:hypothetical protein
LSGLAHYPRSKLFTLPRHKKSREPLVNHDSQLKSCLALLFHGYIQLFAGAQFVSYCSARIIAVFLPCGLLFELRSAMRTRSASPNFTQCAPVFFTHCAFIRVNHINRAAIPDNAITR